MKNYPNRISIKTLLLAVTFCVTIPQILKANDADSIKELYKSRQFKGYSVARKDRTTNLAENEKAEILNLLGCPTTQLEIDLKQQTILKVP